MKKTMLLSIFALVLGCWSCQMEDLGITDQEETEYAESAGPDLPGDDEELECPRPIECPAVTDDGCNFVDGCGFLQQVYTTANALLNNCSTEGLPTNHAWTSTYYYGGGPSLPNPVVTIYDAGCQLWFNNLNDRKAQVVTAAQNLKSTLPSPPTTGNGQWRIVDYDWQTPLFINSSPGDYYQHDVVITYRWAISTVIDEGPGELGPG